MALLTEWLTVWEIAFRWAGKDPGRAWLRLPLEVRDNFRLLMQAILHSQLDCDTLSMNKWSPEDGDDMQPHFIRYHLREVEECVYGIRYDRSLMRWARVERWAYMRWCEGQGIPLPEFWFPPGWHVSYQWPKEAGESDESTDATARPQTRSLYQRRCVACQLIAEAIWKEKPETTIAAMVNDPLIRNYGGARFQNEEVVRRWLSAVAPAGVKAKRGRPTKKKGTEPEPDEAEKDDQ
jgi:hypothetical protein